MITLVLLVAPGIILWKEPTAYTPLVAFILSAALSAASIVASLGMEKLRVEKEVTAKWLPQAQSACDRLLTVLRDLQRLRQSSRTICKSYANMSKDQPNGFDLVLDQYCGSICGRAEGVADHLWSAYNDWERFIGKNCERSECAGIFVSLRERKQQLGLLPPDAAQSIEPKTASELLDEPTPSAECASESVEARGAPVVQRG